MAGPEPVSKTPYCIRPSSSSFSPANFPKPSQNQELTRESSQSPSIAQSLWYIGCFPVKDSPSVGRFQKSTDLPLSQDLSANHELDLLPGSWRLRPLASPFSKWPFVVLLFFAFFAYVTTNVNFGHSLLYNSTSMITKDTIIH